MGALYYVKGLVIEANCEMKDCDLKFKTNMPLIQYGMLPDEDRVKEFLEKNGMFIMRGQIICRLCLTTKFESKNTYLIK